MKPFSIASLAPACFSVAATLGSGCSGHAQTQAVPGAAVSGATVVENQKRPNVLLIVTDDQGAQTGDAAPQCCAAALLTLCTNRAGGSPKCSGTLMRKRCVCGYVPVKIEAREGEHEG